ncbi:SLOG cluster 4 domain-containing protein [Nocardia jiangsuensis]|uniref:LOG family protein n=1 Tax=Nocardia jiangsuensis TaxID=1691563 RepID=A0ABV8DPS4_9NOCA
MSANIRTATFFGGVVPSSETELHLAYGIGCGLGSAGFVVQHGGYNGLMEQAARGAAERGGEVVAVSLAGMAWGEFNPYVGASVHLATMGERLHRFLDGADVVIAMGGGVGTLHELTAALWYAGNIRPVPVWLCGPTALRLAAFLRAERWLFETPTRPLSFLTEIADLPTFTSTLTALNSVSTARSVR